MIQMLQYELDFDKTMQRRSEGRPRNASSWETVDKQCKCGSHIRYTYKNLCVPCQRIRALKYSRTRAEKVKAGIVLSYHKVKQERDDLQAEHILEKIKQQANKTRKKNDN
jgi:hypothetical protein